MKKSMLSAIILAATACLSIGCGQKASVEEQMKEGRTLQKGQEISFQTVEEQRAQGRANAAAAAAQYQQLNPRLHGWDTIPKADTTHSARCPQGDGWAEVVYMRVDRKEGQTKNVEVEKAVVMCSTVSLEKG